MIQQRQGSFFSFESILSLIITIGVMVRFWDTIAGYFGPRDPRAGITSYAYFMAAMTFLALLVIFVQGFVHNLGGGFIWIPFLYVLWSFTTTVFSGIYPFARLPFRFVELFFWVAVMSLGYYGVLSLKTFRFHLIIVLLFLPFLVISFLRMRGQEVTTSDFLLLNPVYFISFLMPMVLLLRSNFIKVIYLLLILIAIIFSFKRMAILGYLSALLIYFYFMAKKNPQSGTLRIFLVLLFGFLVLGGSVFIARELSSMFGLDWSTRMSDIFETGGAGRLARWYEMGVALLTQPINFWFYGHGYGSMSLSYLGYAHNDLIEILYEFGLIGFILYFLFAVRLLKSFFEMIRLSYPHVDAFAASLVWAFWGGMTDVFINFPYWSLAIALFWGVCQADFENFKERFFTSDLLYCPNYDIIENEGYTETT